MTIVRSLVFVADGEKRVHSQGTMKNVGAEPEHDLGKLLSEFRIQ